jgi:hypothetical protein
MRRLVAAVFATMFPLALTACEATGTDVADVSVVTDLPKEVGPGGLQTTVEGEGVASGFVYKAEISDCGPAVLDSAGAWSVRHGWVDAGGEVNERAAQVRLTSDGAFPAALVLRYSLASGRSLARVRITYEWGEGGTAPTPQELSSLAVPELVQATVAAAQCEGSD